MVHVEFNGLSGSGKSTLYRKANSFLERKLGYRPGPDFLWTKMVKDPLLQITDYEEPDFFGTVFAKILKHVQKLPFIPERVRNFQHRLISEQELIRAYNYQRLTQFILTNREYTYRVLQAYPEQKYAVEWDKQYVNLNLEYFLILGTHYQAAKLEQNVGWVMYDEGFYRDLIKYLIDDLGNVKEQGIDIVQHMPHIDLLFYIDTDVETCVSRLRTRADGIPKPYRKFEDNLHTVLMKDKLKDDRLYDYLRGVGKRVVRIDNNGPIEESFAKIAAHLDALYVEKGSCLK
jgi:hypothetical protein